MKAKFYIPYAQGDCVRGFSYGKEISAKDYIDMEIKEYNGHKRGVDQMVQTSMGYNMAINNFKKRHIDYNKQQYNFHECDCRLMNINGVDENTSELDRMYRTKEKFVEIVQLNAQQFNKNPDMETDLNMWISESKKVSNCKKLTDEEVMLHLPKKDFKIYIEDDNTFAVLKDCRFLKLMGSRNSFAIMVNKIIFINER